MMSLKCIALCRPQPATWRAEQRQQEQSTRKPQHCFDDKHHNDCVRHMIDLALNNRGFRRQAET